MEKDKEFWGSVRNVARVRSEVPLLVCADCNGRLGKQSLSVGHIHSDREDLSSTRFHELPRECQLFACNTFLPSSEHVDARNRIVVDDRSFGTTLLTNTTNVGHRIDFIGAPVSWAGQRHFHR